MRRFLASPGTTAIAVGVVALLAVGGGYAIASGGGTIHACAKKSNGALRRANKCKKSEKGVSWGIQGPKGNAGATGAQGPGGPHGSTGPAGPFPSGNLPSGATVRGNFFMTGVAAVSGEEAVDSLSFVYTLASAPTPHFITAGSAAPAGCPGSADDPEAAAGQLCVYEKTASGPVGTCDDCGLDIGGSSCPGSNRWGVAWTSRPREQGASRATEPGR